MAVPHKFADAAWRQTNPVFVILDFLRNADQHVLLLDLPQSPFWPNRLSFCQFGVDPR
jgi:hypothetical protein